MSLVLTQLLERKLTAIIRGVDKNQLPRVAQVLYESGIQSMEIAYDQSDSNTLKKRLLLFHK